jgi:hypothetical protein
VEWLFIAYSGPLPDVPFVLHLRVHCMPPRASCRARLPSKVGELSYEDQLAFAMQTSYEDR